jgi:hypothetical protein
MVVSVVSNSAASVLMATLTGDVEDRHDDPEDDDPGHEHQLAVQAWSPAGAAGLAGVAVDIHGRLATSLRSPTRLGRCGRSRPW